MVGICHPQHLELFGAEPVKKITLYKLHTFKGGHPTVRDGEVTRTINFHWTGGISQWSTTAQVVNCGLFFVYQLQEAPVCRGTYCGSGDVQQGRNKDLKQTRTLGGNMGPNF